MKVNKNYVLRQVANTWVVLPMGEATVNFNGMLKLNESGAMLWRALEQGGDRSSLVKLLTETYDVSEAEAAADVEAFLASLQNTGCLEES